MFLKSRNKELDPSRNKESFFQEAFFMKYCSIVF